VGENNGKIGELNMARITYNNINRKEKGINNIHDVVYATYHFFEYAGEKYFQLDTYGKPTREVTTQPSQKIQFDKKTTEKLIELLSKEFDIKIPFNKETTEIIKKPLSQNTNQLSPPLRINTHEEEQEIKKVKRKIGNWFQNTRQYNSQILYAFIKLHKRNNGVVTYNDLKKESGLETFKSNYDQMKILGSKNHGKIFEQKGENIYFWQKVESIIWDAYKKYCKS